MSEFIQLTAARTSGSKLFSSADGIADEDDVARAVALAAVRHRGEEGRIGLDEQAVERAVHDHLAQLLGVGEGDDAAEGQEGADPQALFCLLLAAAEAVEDRPRGNPLLLEYREGLVPGLPGMDHERQAVAVRQLDLGGEHVTLNSPGRVVVVEVEPALADGDHP